MKYDAKAKAMWLVFRKSFEENLTTIFGIQPQTAKEISRKAKKQYREILEPVPEFEKKDRFKVNLIGCAMLGAYVLNMPERPTVEALTESVLVEHGFI